jgi:hypothetical protein
LHDVALYEAKKPRAADGPLTLGGQLASSDYLLSIGCKKRAKPEKAL